MGGGRPAGILAREQPGAEECQADRQDTAAKEKPASGWHQPVTGTVTWVIGAMAASAVMVSVSVAVAVPAAGMATRCPLPVTVTATALLAPLDVSVTVHVKPAGMSGKLRDTVPAAVLAGMVNAYWLSGCPQSTRIAIGPCWPAAAPLIVLLTMRVPGVSWKRSAKETATTVAAGTVAVCSLPPTRVVVTGGEGFARPAGRSCDRSQHDLGLLRGWFAAPGQEVQVGQA